MTKLKQLRTVLATATLLFISAPLFADSENSGGLLDKATKLFNAGKEATIKGADVVAEKSAGAWDATKEGASKTIDATKDASKKAWDATKSKSQEVAETTTGAAKVGWEKTKDASKSAAGYTKEKVNKLGEAISTKDPAEEPEVIEKSTE